MNLSIPYGRKCCEVYGLFNTLRPCPDMFFAIVDLNGDGSIVPYLFDYQEDRFLHLDTIALVLESPHKDEFKNGFVAPAQGGTGRNIADFLIRHLKSIKLPKKKYKVLLVEAVSYQCSNGTDLKKNAANRDEVFKEVWRNGGDADFKRRLLLYKPEVVINACTGSMKKINSGETLNSLVQQAINSLGCFDGKVFYSVHPCCFHYRSCMTRFYKQ